SFTTRWRPTEPGWTWRVMDVVGSRRWWWSIQPGSLTSIVAVGFIATVGGTGCRIIRGVGRRSTTAAGFGISVWAGAGRRTRFGALPGCAGDLRETIAAGRRCRRELGSLLALG